MNRCPDQKGLTRDVLVSGASEAEALSVVVFTGGDTEDRPGSVVSRCAARSLQGPRHFPSSPSDLSYRLRLPPSAPMTEGVGPRTHTEQLGQCRTAHPEDQHLLLTTQISNLLLSPCWVPDTILCCQTLFKKCFKELIPRHALCQTLGIHSFVQFPKSP